MENATKALLIAGGIMIAVLLLSMSVYLIVSYKEVGTTYQNINLENEVKDFNSNFTKFIGREDITAQEIVSLINYCEEYRNNYGESPEINVINASPYSTTKIKRNGVEFITYSMDAGWNFTCPVGNVSYDEKGKVNKIIFTKI